MRERLTQLCALVERHAVGRRMQTPIPRVIIGLSRERTGILPGLYEPMLCLVLQGAKEVMIGDRRLRYDPASYFIASMELPVSGQIVQASADRPYIAVSLALDWQALAALLPEVPATADAQTAPASRVSPVTAELLDPFQRLLALLDGPNDIPVLAPLFEREILYRMLQGPQGGVLRQIALASGRLSQVRQAIAWIKTHYDQSLRIEALAGMAGMSAASFHRHFKDATAMSPLQYQKNLRLQRARSLLIANADASRAGYAVGYESASQFSREYARLFGAPPARDAVRLRRRNGGDRGGDRQRGVIPVAADSRRPIGPALPPDDADQVGGAACENQRSDEGFSRPVGIAHRRVARLAGEHLKTGHDDLPAIQQGHRKKVQHADGPREQGRAHHDAVQPDGIARSDGGADRAGDTRQVAGKRRG